MLTEQKKLFAKEFLVDLNGTQAAKRAGYSEKSAGSQAERLLKDVDVRKLIDAAMQKRSDKIEITADRVLRQIALRAFADPRKLIENRRCACRHCWGVDHAYQWLDPDEFVVEYQRIITLQVEAEKANKDPAQYREPTDEGGYGYNPTRKPHPECPKCFGEGFNNISAKDSRDYDEEALALYAGVEQTRDGFKIKMHDQDKALDMLMRHLGQYKDGLHVKGTIKHDLTQLTDEQLAAIAMGAADGSDPAPGGG
jgi:phage terminase small subunit